jgi:hypothetical protein
MGLIIFWRFTMKLSKSLLLASVAGLAGVAGAQAADLPSKKAAPVEYVKVCPAYGAGFFYIPGTETCLKVGGYAEFQGYGTNKYSQGAGAGGHTDAVNTHALARITLDARNTTEYGLLRTFARIQWDRSSGSDDNSGSQPRRGQYFNSNGGNYQNVQTGFSGSEGFVQLGGFLAGRTTSFAFVGAPSLLFTTQGPSNGRVNQAAYTFAFADGLSLTAAVEDAAEIRQGTFRGVDNGAANSAPDGTVSFDVAQAWGSVKAAGVIHQVYFPTVYAGGGGQSSKTGYAGMLGAKVNLPMIGAGDYIYAYGAYGEGTTGRTLGNTTSDTKSSNGSGGVGNALFGVYDATISATGQAKLAKSYSFGAEVKHYFTPALAAYFGGSYGAVDYGSNKMAASTAGSDPHNSSLWGLALGAIWSPVAGFEVNPEVAYRYSKIDSTTGINNGLKKGVKNDDQWFGRLRVARSF